LQLFYDKGGASQQPRFVREELGDIVKTRKLSLDRFIAALKRQIGQQGDIMDNYMEDYLVKR